jgi:hypothetical protein
VKLSISEAARRAGVRRNTLYRKLDSGRLSREIDPDGKPVIDLAELCRVYPQAETDRGHTEKKQIGTEESAPQTQVLQQLVDSLKADKERLIEELERVRAEARADIDREHVERDRILGLLEIAQRQLADLRQPEAKAEPQVRRRRGLWARLIGA